MTHNTEILQSATRIIFRDVFSRMNNLNEYHHFQELENQIEGL